MTCHTAPLHFETLAAEWPKFTAPLLLVPGLWCQPTAWRRCMGYFAHRGWTCHALAPGGTARPASVAAWRDVVQDAVQSCAAPPVLVGHDLGGWLALQGTMREVRAVVALAPLVPRVLARRGHPAMTGWAAWWALRRRTAVPAPAGALAPQYFADGVPGGNVPEPAALLRGLTRLPPVSTPSPIPALVVAGERDAVCPPDEVGAFAQSLGAAFRVAPAAGHALPWESGWEGRVRIVHRWLVRTLGEPLLATLDDEDA
jgi:non-heme chloroperoxidase